MEGKKSKKKALLAASVAGLLALTGLVASHAVYAEDVHCYGVNGCKGQGECGGKGHSCAGKNACKGQGWVAAADEAACTKLEGRLTEEVSE